MTHPPDTETFRIARYTPVLGDAVRAFAECTYPPSAFERAHLDRAAATDFVADMACLLALADTPAPGENPAPEQVSGGEVQATPRTANPKVAAVLSVLRRPVYSNTGRLIALFPSLRASPASRALVGNAVHELAALGVSGLHLMLGNPPEEELGAARDAGFEPVQELIGMAMPLDTPLAPVPAGIDVTLYGGGDGALNEQIACVMNDTLKDERVVPLEDGAGVAAMIAEPGAVWFVATDRATGEVAGVAEIFPDRRLWNMIGIAPRYRGIGLSDHITARGIALMRERGMTGHVHTLARPDNPYSHRLQERLGGSGTGLRVVVLRKDIGE